jgi:hypothetical protein
MPRAFHKLPTLALGILLTAPGAVDAQSIPSPYTFVETRQELGLFGGYVSASTGRFGFGPAGGLTYGARYAVRLSGPMSLEGVAGLIQGTRDIINPSLPEDSWVVGEGDVLLTTVDARLRLAATGDRAWHGLGPFLVLGAGVAFDFADTPEANELLQERDVFDFGTSFYGTLGVGTHWYVMDRLAVRTDGTFSLWRLKTPPGFSDTDRPFTGVENREWVRSLGVTVSLIYRW